jgi:protein-L-isoaspartate(D-aspartate) O-methyltransferase
MTYDQRLRSKLARVLRKNGSIRSEHVEEAFASIPRHLFVPDKPLKQVYSDQAFPTLREDGTPITSSSQPSIMAIMLEQLELSPGQRVLEIGAGTGYNAALLSHLVGPRGRVTSIDINAEVAKGARAHLRAAGVRGVRVVTGDGGFGWPDGAPYDRIIATASCWQIPGTWCDQLVEGGLLVLPFRLNGAHVVLALKRQGDQFVSTRASGGGFMPLLGAFSPARTFARFENVRIMADYELTKRDRSELAAVLASGRPARVTYPRFRDARNTPLHYLILQDRPVVMMDSGSQALPFALIASPRSAVAIPWFRPERGRVKLFGSNEALDLLRDGLARWQAAGRPDARDLRMTVSKSIARLGPLPHRSGERWRFRRGAHVYEVWFER